MSPYLRSLINFPERVTQLSLACQLGSFLYKLVIYGFMNERTRTSAAT